MKVTDTEIKSSLAFFYTMLKALRNTDNSDISNLLANHLKQDYNLMNRTIDKFLDNLETNLLDKKSIEILDESSYKFLDMLAIFLDKKNIKLANTFYAIVCEFVEGKAKIIDDYGEKHALPYAFEYEGKLLYPDQTLSLDKNLLTPLYK